MQGKSDIEVAHYYLTSTRDQYGDRYATGATSPDGKTIRVDTEVCGVLEYELGTDANLCKTNGLSSYRTDKSDLQIAFEIFIYTLFHEFVHALRIANGLTPQYLPPPIKPGQERKSGKNLKDGQRVRI